MYSKKKSGFYVLVRLYRTMTGYVVSYELEACTICLTENNRSKSETA
jgi:hypothetical protein